MPRHAVSPARILATLVASVFLILGSALSASAAITPTSGPASGGTAVTVDGIRFVQISAGSSFTLGLTSEGTVYAWGQNFQGMLGNGTTTGSSTPVQVLGVGGTGVLSGISQVEAGGEFSMALSTSGSVYSWGRNAEGQLGQGATSAISTTPVLVVAGAQGSGSLSNVTSIAAGYQHALALVGGNVFAWGDNTSGKLGDGTTTNRPAPVRVLTGAQADGSGNLANITQLSAGFHFSLARTTTGALYAWGGNTFGQLGIGTSTGNSTTPVAVTAGAQSGSGTFTAATFISSKGGYSVALTANGLFAWGSNIYGQIGNGTTTDVTAPSRVLGGAQGGTNLSDVTLVSAGNFQVIAVTTSGVYSWGENSEGQMGNGTTGGGVTLPVRVLAGAQGSGNLSDVTAVVSGYQSSYALTNSGLFAWGKNDAGELSDGTLIRRTTPVFSANFQPASVVFANATGTALTASGNSWSVTAPAGATGQVAVTATANVFGGTTAASPATVSWNAGTFTYEAALANTGAPDMLPLGLAATGTVVLGAVLLIALRRIGRK